MSVSYEVDAGSVKTFEKLSDAIKEAERIQPEVGVDVVIRKISDEVVFSNGELHALKMFLFPNKLSSLKRVAEAGQKGIPARKFTAETRRKFLEIEFVSERTGVDERGAKVPFFFITEMGSDYLRTNS